MRSQRRTTREVRLTKIRDLYTAGDSGNLMDPRYADNRKVQRALQRRHAIATNVDEEGVYRAETFSIVRRNGRLYRKRHRHEWKVPYGILYYWRKPLRRHQMVVLHPWQVTWKSKRTGKRLYKRFSSLPSAVDFITTRAQYVDPHASVISRTQHYDIPPKLRGKIPKPWLWCPRCVTARKFYRKRPEEEFYALKKVPGSDRHGNEYDGRGNRIYEWKERKLAVLVCKVCGCTNRDHHFRRSNQPWEKRKFKRGVTRAKRTRSSGSSLSRTRRRRRRS